MLNKRWGLGQRVVRQLWLLHPLPKSQGAVSWSSSFREKGSLALAMRDLGHLPSLLWTSVSGDRIYPAEEGSSLHHVWLGLGCERNTWWVTKDFPYLAPDSPAHPSSLPPWPRISCPGGGPGTFSCLSSCSGILSASLAAGAAAARTPARLPGPEKGMPGGAPELGGCPGLPPGRGPQPRGPGRASHGLGAGGRAAAAGSGGEAVPGGRACGLRCCLATRRRAVARWLASGGRVLGARAANLKVPRPWAPPCSPGAPPLQPGSFPLLGP